MNRRKLLLGLAVALGFMIILEAGLRVGSTVHHDLTRPPEWRPAVDFLNAHVLSPTIGWERRPSYIGRVANTRRQYVQAGYFVQDAPKVHDTSRRRVWFLGDSRTFGWGVNVEQTFAEVVERKLGVAAINLAVPGYSTYQGHLALKRWLELAPQPDAVVLAFDYNDRRYGTPDSGPHFQTLAKAASRQFDGLEHVYIYRAMRGLMRRVGLIPEPPSRMLAVRTMKPRVSEQDYAANLAALVMTARAARVPVFFLELDDNPIQTYHLRTGVQALRTGDYPAAIAHLSVADADTRHGFEAVSRIYLAEAYRRYGDTTRQRAAEWYYDAHWSSTGGAPIRLASDYHAILRRVAQEYDVTVIDGTVEPRQYFDGCHFTVEGHEQVGRAVAMVLRRL